MTIFEAALSSASGRGFFHLTPHPDQSRFVAHVPDARRVRVALERGDALLPSRPVHLLKLDVEGAELAALEGLRRILSSPDIRLLVECNPEALHRAGSSARELLERLRGLGFIPYLLDEARQELVPVGDRGRRLCQSLVQPRRGLERPTARLSPS